MQCRYRYRIQTVPNRERSIFQTKLKRVDLAGVRRSNVIDKVTKIVNAVRFCAWCTFSSHLLLHFRRPDQHTLTLNIVLLPNVGFELSFCQMSTQAKG